MAEVVFGPDPEADESPTAAVDAGCFRQVEFAGILRGTDEPELARALIDHLLAPETQAELPLAMYVYPARSDVELPEVFARHALRARGPAEPRPGGHRRGTRGLDPRVDRHRPALTRRQALLLAAPPLAFLALFFLWPVANILALGLAPDGQLQLGAILEAWRQPYVGDVVLFTLGLATVSTLLTLLLGLPVAWVLARFEFPGRRALRALTVVPFVLPTVVVGSAFLALLGPRSPLNALAELAFGADVPQVRLDGSAAAIVVAHVFYNVAVVVRLVGGLWAHLDPRLEEAARVLGASPWAAFREVTWPLLRPAVLSAASIVFLFTVTSFGVVLLLGGPRDTTLEVEIYRQTAILLDLPTAAALTILQMVGVLALLLLERPGAGAPGRPAAPARRRRDGTAAAARPRARPRGGHRGARPRSSCSRRSSSSWSAPWPGRTATASTRSPALLREDPRTRLAAAPIASVVDSLLFAVATTLIAGSLGLLAAAVVGYRRGWLARSLDALVMLPLGTSAVIVGFGFLVSLDTPPLDLRTSILLIPIAHCARRAALRDARHGAGHPRHRRPPAGGGGGPGRLAVAGLARGRRAHPGARGARRAPASPSPSRWASSGRRSSSPGPTRSPSRSPSSGCWAARRGQLRDGHGAGDRAHGPHRRRDAAHRAAARQRAAGLLGRDGRRPWIAASRVAARGLRPQRRLRGADILHGIDLEVPAGQLLCLLGPSGGGKSTLLRAIAGLEEPRAGQHPPGRSRPGGRARPRARHRPHVPGLRALPAPRRRRQRGLRAAHAAASTARRRRARVRELLELVGLAGAERRSVSQLSGGEQQRVALARALAPRPRLLMLDEPMGSLDRSLRERLPEELRTIFAGLGLTTIYVTHDQDEALSVADRVVVLDERPARRRRHARGALAAPHDGLGGALPGFPQRGRGSPRRTGAWRPPGARCPPRRLTAGPRSRGLAAGELAERDGDGADVVVVLRAAGLVAVADGPIRGRVASRRFRGDHVLFGVEVAGRSDAARRGPRWRAAGRRRGRDAAGAAGRRPRHRPGATPAGRRGRRRAGFPVAPRRATLRA